MTPDRSIEWQVVIFMVDGKANHAGLAIPGHGLADLSLRGARIVPWDAPSLPKGERLFYDIVVPAPQRALDYLNRPGLLTAAIIDQEKQRKGWHLTAEAPDFVRTLRSRRSCDPDDMNCIEWIVHALELGGLPMPHDVLTPMELLQWCEARAIRSEGARVPSAPART